MTGVSIRTVKTNKVFLFGFIVSLYFALNSALPKSKALSHNGLSSFISNVVERQSETCECGVGNRKRIVGGVQTVQDSYPWMTAIYWSSGELMCGGAVINEAFILSASHCFPGVVPDDIYVILGDYDRGTTLDATPVQMGIQEIIRHELYGVKNRVDSDIALLRTKRRVIFTKSIQPICLPPPKTEYVGKTGIASGWGATSFGGTESNMQLEVDIPIIPDSICKENFSTFYTENMMCGGYLDGGKDACQGDSGGPLTVSDENSVYEVVGIISFGRGCASPGYPGVYTKMINFIDWILEKTKGTPRCTKPNKNPATCGVANNPSRKKRIIGGIETSQNQYPWTAAVILTTSDNRLQLRCGATLISERWLTTTARCVSGYTISSLSVGLGERNLSQLAASNKRISLSTVVIHPNFQSTTTFAHDIALIKLSKAVEFSTAISPICLPPGSWTGEVLNDIEGVVTGWGKSDKRTTIEQQVFLKIITDTECKRFYGNSLPPYYICAGGVVGEDICDFDFGGQFSLTSDDDLYRLVGVQAFSAKDNCGKGYPAGMIRVTSYLKWITETTGVVTFP